MKQLLVASLLAAVIALSASQQCSKHETANTWILGSGVWKQGVLSKAACFSQCSGSCFAASWYDGCSAYLGGCCTYYDQQNAQTSSKPNWSAMVTVCAKDMQFSGALYEKTDMDVKGLERMERNNNLAKALAKLLQF